MVLFRYMIQYKLFELFCTIYFKVFFKSSNLRILRIP